MKTSVQNVISNVYEWLKKKENLLQVAFFCVILLIFIVNTFHEKYPDEFDNILGGWYIIHGLPIYTSWFTHHGPIAYFIAAVIELFTRNSFVAFRFVYSIVLFAFTLWSYVYLRKRFGEKPTRFYLLFIFFLALMGNYYWLHMLLADSISAFLFAPIFAMLILLNIYHKRITVSDVTVISVLISLSLLSSLTYTYVSLIIYAYVFFYYLRSNKVRLFSFKSLQAILIFGAPYLAFLVYLLVTFSFNDYIEAAISFNQKYYIYNYPRPEGTTFINPIRFAVVIANTFFNNYLSILHQIPSFNLGFPLNITMGIGSLGILIYLLVTRYYTFFVVTLGLFIFSNARSNPLTSAERDYQSAVYIIFCFIAITFLISYMPVLIEQTRYFAYKILLTLLFGVLVVYTFFSTGLLLQKFHNRTYQKYMGTMSLIYDRPHIAPILNTLIKPNDPIWIGPFEFEELFYTHGRPASKYQILLPGMGSSPKMQKELLKELSETKPEIIWFQKNFHILGRSPEQYGQFFISYLDREYVTVGDYIGQEGERYKSLLATDEWIDIDTRLYMRKEVAESIIDKLIKQNYITVKVNEES